MRTQLISHRPQRRREHPLGCSTPLSRGFTLVELLVVAAIMVVVTTIALPTLPNVLALAKLRGGMGDLSGLFQTCRSQAIKTNVVKHLIFTTRQGVTLGFVDGIPGSGLNTSLPQVWLPSQFSKAAAAPDGSGGTPAPLIASTMWGGSSTTVPDTTDDMCFNSRGIPCTCTASSTAYCTGITNGYAFYFTNGSQPGKAQWAAVGVSPAGRIKTFFWNGSAWAN